MNEHRVWFKVNIKRVKFTNNVFFSVWRTLHIHVTSEVFICNQFTAMALRETIQR